jgi:predicted GNAT superfamily acetyltransferase/predicted GIY-YIG superfamily endonuclease
MVDLRVLDNIPSLERVVDLEIAIWGLSPRDAVPASFLHTSIHNGGVVVGAFQGDRLIGLAYAFPAYRGKKPILWSHMTGVHPDFRGIGIGYLLKQAQRQWALDRGYRFISWTFDPLQRGNANFNLHRLGATASVYHENFYGEMTDEINIGLPSDRLEVQWDLRSTRVNSVKSGTDLPTADACENAVFVLKANEANSSPMAVDEFQDGIFGQYVYAEIPFNLGLLKQVNPAIAMEWRLALRRVLKYALSRGCQVLDFVTYGQRCWYVLGFPEAWYLYVVRCDDDSLYTGITSDLVRRVKQHNTGRGASYTASRRPVNLVAAWRFAGRNLALQAEASFKSQRRATKLHFIRRQMPFCDAPFIEVPSF